MKIAAIGTFDGVHRGHQSVLKVMKDHAGRKGLEPVAVTFDQHPLAHIAPERTPMQLTSLEEKKKLLKEAGVVPVVVEFNETLRSTTAAGWLRRLKEEWAVKALVIGYDNTFGCDGVNMSVDDYKKIGEAEGIEVFTAEEIKGVSSSAIRKAVAKGDVEKAREMLGRPYTLTSKIVKGNGIGHTIGFPTANMEMPGGVAFPKPGVYEATVRIEGEKEWRKAMVNIGNRPTVGGGGENIMETHIIDWDGDLYGKDVTVGFLSRIRDEKKFDSIDELRKQLEQDMDLCKSR